MRARAFVQFNVRHPTRLRPLSRRQVRAVDRIAMEQYGLPGVVLMENAGRGAAEFILSLLPDDGTAPVVVCCGAGNNGGDGFVIARHLSNAGLPVECAALVPPARLAGDAAIHAQVADRMGIPIRLLDDPHKRAHALTLLPTAAAIVDALLGTGATGDPRPPADEIIHAINSAGCRLVVAVDLPSGLDCDSGRPGSPTVRASHTVTFVAPKQGFDAPSARAYVGVVHVVDIGIPRAVIDAAWSA